MKSALPTSLFFLQLLFLSSVYGQDSIKSANEEISFDSNELIKFLRKPMLGSPRIVSKDAKFGLIDSNGSTLVPIEYDLINVDFSYREKLLLIEKYRSENELFYSYWEEGNESQELYDQLREQELQKTDSPLNLETKFRENPFFVAKSGDYWGVINALNEILIPFEYNSIEDIGQDILLVEKNNGFSILSPKNDVIIPPCDTIIKPSINDYSLPYGNRFAAYAMLINDDKYGAINLFSGEFVRPKYDSLEYCYSLPEDHCTCAFNLHDICLNCTEGQTKRNHHYRNIVKYKSGNKIGLFDMTSMQELTPASYDFIDIYGMRDGQIVQLDSMYTFLTYENMSLHEHVYDSVSFLNRAFYKVQIAGKTGVYNHFGEPILKIGWDDITTVCLNSKSYYFVVNQRGKYGVVDDRGRFTVRAKYDDISPHFDREIGKRFLLLKRKGEVEKLFTEDL